MPELAIVLATYNEAENLPPLIEALEGLGEDLEIVLVDDSSPDGTYKVAQRLSDRFGNLTLIQRPAKLGLGSALRDGLAAAHKSGAAFTLTMDADLSHDPREAPRLLEAIRTEGADVVQGSRYMPGGTILNWGLGAKGLEPGREFALSLGSRSPAGVNNQLSCLFTASGIGDSRQGPRRRLRVRT